MRLGRPAVLVLRCTLAVTGIALAAAVAGTLLMTAIAALVTSGSSAIAKAALDSSLQDDLPEESRASAFGRSESMLQLAWVLGGAMGVLLYTDLWIGFSVVTVAPAIRRVVVPLDVPVPAPGETAAALVARVDVEGTARGHR